MNSCLSRKVLLSSLLCPSTRCFKLSGLRQLSISTRVTRPICKPYGYHVRYVSGSASGSAQTQTSAIWTAQTAKQLDFSTILSELPTVTEGSEANKVLFLVTPGVYASFMKQLESLTNQIHSRNNSSGDHETFVAVVDALPTEDGHSQGRDGLAVCLSDHLDYIEAPSEITDKPLIGFKTQIGDRLVIAKNRLITYQGPVANTLFVNGNQHTMFRHAPDSSSPSSFKNVEHLVNLEINFPLPYQHPSAPLTNLSTSLHRLAPTRRIASSMGNVIRQITLDNDTPGAASAELERIVPPFLRHLQSTQPDGELQVYALLYPPSLLSTMPQISSLFPTTDIHTDDHALVDSTILSQMLHTSARIHRVTSGGGGWGKKAGLLSLEPALDFTYDDTVPKNTMFPSLDFDDPFTDKAHKTNDPSTSTAITELVPEGWYIQFLASYHSLNPSPAPSISKSRTTTSPGIQQANTRGIEHEVPSPDELAQQQTWTIGTTTLPENLEPTASNWLSTEQINAEAVAQMSKHSSDAEPQTPASAGTIDTSSSRAPQQKDIDVAAGEAVKTDAPAAAAAAAVKEGGKATTGMTTTLNHFGFLTTGPVCIRVMEESAGGNRGAKRASGAGDEAGKWHSTLFAVPNSKITIGGS